MCNTWGLCTSTVTLAIVWRRIMFCWWFSLSTASSKPSKVSNLPHQVRLRFKLSDSFELCKAGEECTTKYIETFRVFTYTHRKLTKVRIVSISVKWLPFCNVHFGIQYAQRAEKGGELEEERKSSGYILKKAVYIEERGCPESGVRILKNMQGDPPFPMHSNFWGGTFPEF